MDTEIENMRQEQTSHSTIQWGILSIGGKKLFHVKITGKDNEYKQFTAEVTSNPTANQKTISSLRGEVIFWMYLFSNRERPRADIIMPHHFPIYDCQSPVLAAITDRQERSAY